MIRKKPPAAIAVKKKFIIRGAAKRGINASALSMNLIMMPKKIIPASKISFCADVLNINNCVKK